MHCTLYMVHPQTIDHRPWTVDQKLPPAAAAFVETGLVVPWAVFAHGVGVGLGQLL